MYVPNAADNLETLMAARHPPGVHSRMKAGYVGVAGVGGLGSHVAVMLARMGVGTLLLVDYDMVEPSNLNRQHYAVSHLSTPKTLALKSQIADINPYVRVMTRDIRLTAKNAADVFADCPIVVEALDDPACKADLVAALLGHGGFKIVAASGIAGYGDANLIKTLRRLSSLYICGDLETEPGPETGLTAPRVAICAGHQANMVVRLLMGLE